MSVHSVNGETRELIVLLPLGDAYEDPELIRQIEAALMTAFPDFRFRVTAEGLPRMPDDFFTLIPVLGEAGSADSMLLCPPLATYKEIGVFLRGFVSPRH